MLETPAADHHFERAPLAAEQGAVIEMKGPARRMQAGQGLFHIAARIQNRIDPHAVDREAQLAVVQRFFGGQPAGEFLLQIPDQKSRRPIHMNVEPHEAPQLVIRLPVRAAAVAPTPLT